MEGLRTVVVICPYCGETLELVVEADLAGELVQDCEVCCNPWSMTVRTLADGSADVRVRRLDD